jgi:hypothetical protein
MRSISRSTLKPVTITASGNTMRYAATVHPNYAPFQLIVSLTYNLRFHTSRGASVGAIASYGTLQLASECRNVFENFLFAQVAKKKINALLRNTKFHYRNRRNPPLNSILIWLIQSTPNNCKGKIIPQHHALKAYGGRNYTRLDIRSRGNG